MAPKENITANDGHREWRKGNTSNHLQLSFSSTDLTRGRPTPAPELRVGLSALSTESHSSPESSIPRRLFVFARPRWSPFSLSCFLLIFDSPGRSPSGRYWLSWCRAVFVQVWRCQQAAAEAPAGLAPGPPPVWSWWQSVEDCRDEGDVQQCGLAWSELLTHGEDHHHQTGVLRPASPCRLVVSRLVLLSPSSREAELLVLTPARAGLLWLIALTSHCRQLSSPRPSQQNQ